MHRVTDDHVVQVLETELLVERRIGSLSGCEKRRAALGRALLASPKLILLDEPLAGLDAGLIERLIPHLKRVRHEFSIPLLYVTHSPEEVMALCDDVVVLQCGIVTKNGDPKMLFAPTESPQHRLEET